MVTREEIIWLYRCILGREPESDDAIASNLHAFSAFAQARLAFLESREFKILDQKRNQGDVYYIPARQRPFEKPADKLGLVSIVKDEAKRIAPMLQSALPLVDFVALVDTGSADETSGIAREILGRSGVEHQIVSVDFVDFAHARNASLDLLPPRIEWALVLDADEHLVQEDYQRFVDLADVQEIDAWNLPRFNFVDKLKKEPAAPYPDFQSRMFRNRSVHPIRYEGAVHEVLINVHHWGIAPSNGPDRQSMFGGPHIHHMGQVDLTLDEFYKKHHFYERLMKRLRIKT